MAQARISTIGRATAACLVAAAAAASALADTSAAEEPPIARLEQQFWACDYAATQGRVDTGDAIACARWTDQLKVRKFNGDFSAMLAWWQQHKEAEHLALAAAGGTSVARVAAGPR